MTKITTTQDCKETLSRILMDLRDVVEFIDSKKTITYSEIGLLASIADEASVSIITLDKTKRHVFDRKD